MPVAGETAAGHQPIKTHLGAAMSNVSMQYRFEQHPLDRIVLTPIPSVTDGMQVVEHDIEEITLVVPDWDEEEYLAILH